MCYNFPNLKRITTPIDMCSLYVYYIDVLEDQIILSTVVCLRGGYNYSSILAYFVANNKITFTER